MSGIACTGRTGSSSMLGGFWAAALLLVGVGAEYKPLGTVIHDTTQQYDAAGRIYTMHGDGGGSWEGASATLPGATYLRHPPITTTSFHGTTLRARALKCDAAAAVRCRLEYDHCVRYEGPANDLNVACHCSRVLFSQCLHAAGCSQEVMKECYQTMAEQKCRDTIICGNNCVLRQSESVALTAPAAITIQVLNAGNNFLKISTCNRTYDASTFDRFGTLNEEDCGGSGGGGGLRACPYWLPPKMLTSFTFDADATHMWLEQCVLTEGGHTRCLDSPKPMRIDGTAARWPAVLEVEQTARLYCDDDQDCPASECLKNPLPPHTCYQHKDSATPVFQGFVQGGNPAIVPEDWKVLIRHVEFVPEEVIDAAGVGEDIRS